MESKLIIIGAGLSGLTTAYFLSKQGFKDFLVLEGRDIVGGRILTKNSIDFGATWFQNHHTELNHLLSELGLEKFPQYDAGKSILVYNTMAPAHYFESSGAPTAFRMVDGSQALPKKLASFFESKIHFEQKVQAIHKAGDRIMVETGEKTYWAEKVICTLPPKLAYCLDFEPKLSENLTSAMTNTHTWMSNAIKIGMTFATPFWREKGFSGTVIGQVGPVIELYDHCDHKNKSYALMGFVNEGLRDVTAEQRKERILSYLENFLGKEIREHTSYEEKDWSIDRMSSCENLKSVYMSPQYGNPIFERWHLDGHLLFSGTETSPRYGGYLDGAVYSGKRAAQQLLVESQEQQL